MDGFHIRFLRDGVGVGRQLGWGGESELGNGGPRSVLVVVKGGRGAEGEV